MIRRWLPDLLQCFIQGLACNLLRLSRLFVVGAVWQGMATVQDFNFPPFIFTDCNRRMAHGIGRAFGLDLVDHFLVLQSEVLTQSAGFLPGETTV